MKRANGSILPVLGLVMSFGASHAIAADWPQWRGPHRDGISQEKSLLRTWPESGPKLLWRADGIGRGYSTPAVVGDRLFLLASEGTNNEFVQARGDRKSTRLNSSH